MNDPNTTSRPACGPRVLRLRTVPYGPQQLGVVGNDEHPITGTLLPRERQFHLKCRCGWTAVAVTLNHTQLLTGRHAPEPQPD